MSLLDNVINAATSAISGNGEQSQAMQLVSQLIQQNGGNVGDLLGKLQQGGLGGSLSNAAAKVGLDTGSASNLLAQYLPNIINAITPNGNAADADGFGLDDIARIVMQNFLK